MDDMTARTIATRFLADRGVLIDKYESATRYDQLRTHSDPCWTVRFRLPVEEGVIDSVDTVIVVVNDVTGAAEFCHGL
jgi:hypothetical protein